MSRSRTTEDLRGMTFGKLTVLYDFPFYSKNNYIAWTCICDCGNKKVVEARQLKAGNTKSCGCLPKGNRPGLIQDISDRKFYRLTPIEPTGEKVGLHYIWRCHCICGNETKASATNLIQGIVKSCGCLKSAQSQQNIRKAITAITKYDNPIIAQKYSNYRISAESNGRVFELTYDQFKNIITQSCLYCGSTGRFFKQNTHRMFLNGIDRRDNRFGYTIDNSVPCCHSCNSRKGTRSAEYVINRNRELGIAA
jgi:hypothetical protein